MELREQHALFREHIHRWRSHDGIAQASVVAVAHVVGHDEDNVGLLSRSTGGSQMDKKRHRL